MAKIPRTLIGSAFADAKDIPSFFKAIRTVWEKMAAVVNSQISFGDGNHQQADNINGVWVPIVTPATANTDFVVTHNLGRIPSGYILMQTQGGIAANLGTVGNPSCCLYQGNAAPTATQMTLRCTGTNLTLILFIV